MATKPEIGVKPRRKITTYGKSVARKPPPSGLGTPHASSAASKQPTTRRNDLDVSSPEPLLQDAPPNARSDKSPKAERKRKLSQVYAPVGPARDPLRSSDDSSPTPPTPRRSRVSSADQLRTSKDGSKSVKDVVRAPSSASPRPTGVESTGTRLSSPPPTPTPPKDRRRIAGKVSKQAFPFSPNTMQILDGLQVVEKEKQVQREQQIPVRLAQEQDTKPRTSKPSVLYPARTFPTSTGARPTASTPQRSKRRLIDALVEQIPDEQEHGMETPLEGHITWNEPISASQMSDASSFEPQPSPAQSSSPRRAQSAAKARTYARPASSLKYTYGQSKITMLEENNLLEAMAIPSSIASLPKGRRLELGARKPLASSSMDLDDDPAAASSMKAKIRDIHELKQAGANTRVADEMHDLSSQIGSAGVRPSSSRRAALLQIAERMSEKDFRRRIRDHGVEALIFKEAGKEGDTISGYLIATILVHVLATSSSPHVIQLLREQEVGGLFAQLLRVDEDITKLSRDRRSNLSKRSQITLAATETALLELSVWSGGKPSYLSPRAVTLKCLALIIDQDVDAGKEQSIFPSNVTDGLFSVLSVAGESEFWQDSPDVEALDVQTALSVLEFHVVKAMDSQRDGDEWISQYLATVADAFEASLHNPPPHNSELEDAVLKLVLNMANFSSSASEAFARKQVLAALSTATCKSFARAQELVSADDAAEGFVTGLILKLCVLVNFAEQSMPVRRTLYECRDLDGSPVHELIRLFLENHRITAEADSEAKGHLNVAFGYLSVLLGYLALYAPVRKLFRSSHSARSMGPLLDSIQEFISHHRAMEASLLDASEDDPRAHGGYTEKLQAMVNQLQNDAAYD